MTSHPREPEQLKPALSRLLGTTTKAMFIGIGNEFRGDDGAGIALVRCLMSDKDINVRKECRFIDAGLSLVNHLDTIASERPGLLVLMDCVELKNSKSAEGKSAAPFCFLSLQDDVSQVIVMRSFSTHQLPLEFVKAFLDRLVPETRLFLLGIDYESLEHTEELFLSPTVGKTVDELYTLIKEALLDSFSR